VSTSHASPRHASAEAVNAFRKRNYRMMCMPWRRTLTVQRRAKEPGEVPLLHFDGLRQEAFDLRQVFEGALRDRERFTHQQCVGVVELADLDQVAHPADVEHGSSDAGLSHRQAVTLLRDGKHAVDSRAAGCARTGCARRARIAAVRATALRRIRDAATIDVRATTHAVRAEAIDVASGKIACRYDRLVDSFELPWNDVFRQNPHLAAVLFLFADRDLALPHGDAAAAYCYHLVPVAAICRARFHRSPFGRVCLHRAAARRRRSGRSLRD
jgi:hypothetical protein